MRIMDTQYVVVFDCESDCGFGDVFGRARDEIIHRYMQFTCICALVIPTNAIQSHVSTDEIISRSRSMTWWRDVSESSTATPIDSLLDTFDRAKAIVGFNCLAFDFPLIKRFYTSQKRYLEHRCKCLDIMTRVRDVTCDYYKLDKLLKDNELSSKIGDGRTAIKLWQEGRRDELEAYCLRDVELTARLGLLKELCVREKHSTKTLTIPGNVFGIRAALSSLTL
jgi:hypothetical protein